MKEALKRAEEEKAKYDQKNKEEFMQLMKEAEEKKQELQDQFLESQESMNRRMERQMECQIVQSQANAKTQEKRLSVMESSYKLFSDILGKFTNTFLQKIFNDRDLSDTALNNDFGIINS